MMSNLPVLVFPGQGAQAVGMGRDIAEASPEARALFARADALLGFGISQIIFEGPEAALVDTAVQQPALVLTGLAIKQALETKLGRKLECAAAVGLSLGEYAALAAAGALEFDQALKLVRRRGELMQMAAQKAPSGMMVVINLAPEKIQAACEQAVKETGGVASLSNFNGGGQIVIGGTHETLARAGELCKAAGAKRAMKLAVAGAFHTVLMQPAADAFAADLDAARVQAASAPVYANVSAAAVQSPDAIRDALKRQITSPVLWEQTVKNLAAAGHKTFLELGPGSTVCNMIKRIIPDAECRAVSTWADVQAFQL